MPDLSSLLFGGPEGCPQGYSARGRFDSSRLPTPDVLTSMYLCARCSILGTITGDRSINDQKNLDGLSPIRNAWMAREGWMVGTPRTCEANCPTNWERDSSFPWANPRREAVVGFGRALAKKCSSNSFANKSNEDIEAGCRRQHHVLADPLRVVGKARHINASDVSYRAI
ncbi:hypothetical protein B296_00016280 [Ensete ventricosum]|uniref:Uncharacterized protein n=1 Tax=Ensete ventricosum TaxID=4639 RepID=A0A426ZL16_ENSVE|nr:hypothetical protein B296_00016280 [Ensete ventricosum]